MPGFNSQVGARSALFESSCHCVMLSSFCCYCVVLLLCCSVIIVLFIVLIVCTVTLPPGVNPIAVDKYIYLILSPPILLAFPTESLCIYRVSREECARLRESVL